MGVFQAAVGDEQEESETAVWLFCVYFFLDMIPLLNYFMVFFPSSDMIPIPTLVILVLEMSFPVIFDALLKHTGLKHSAL